MKHQDFMDRMDESVGMEQRMSPMHEHLEEEKMRHEHAMDHQRNHLERHHGRPYNSQHGHDNYKY